MSPVLRLSVLVAAVAAIVCPAQALEIRPASPAPEQHRFNPNDIVSQVRRAARQPTGTESPTFDGEFLVDTSITYTPATYYQIDPAIAFGHTDFLVVWQDKRNDLDDDIYGARVTPGGTLLDPAGIPISTAADEQCVAAVAFGDTNFFVVWMDEHRDSWDIHGARVSQAGTVLDPEGIRLSAVANFENVTAVAFDGTNFLVIWGGPGNDGFDIYGARVSQAGAVLDPGGIPISTAARDEFDPAVAFDGANFLVAWESRRNPETTDVYGCRVSPAGTVLDPDGFPVSSAEGSQFYPAVAFDGVNSLVVWEDGRPGGINFDIYGARVTPAGTVLDTFGVAISAETLSQYQPAAAFDGANFLVVWDDIRNGRLSDIYGARVTPAGTVLDSAGIITSTAANRQRFPAAASGEEEFLVVWEDYRKRDTSDIFGARVSHDGTILDPAGIAISAKDGAQVDPAAAFDGTNFLVVWELTINTGDDIYGARVTPGGTVLDPSGIPISTAVNWQVDPAVASGGTNFLVVWRDCGGGSYDIYGARVSRAGVVIDPYGIPISTASNYQRYPAVAYDGVNFLTVWCDWRAGHDIYGARMTPAGVVLDTEGIRISIGADYEGDPAVAYDGTDFLVMWAIGDIHGARVTPGGVVADRGPVVRQQGEQRYPALCRGGGQMLLTYQGWAGTAGGRSYNTQRIWGKMNPSPAVAEMAKPGVRMPNSGATIVRGVLFIPSSGAVLGYSQLGDSPLTLLDISGRWVMSLKPGANDVRHLSPGVYFIRPHPDLLTGAEREKAGGTGSGRQGSSVRKVIVTE